MRTQSPFRAPCAALAILLGPAAAQGATPRSEVDHARLDSILAEVVREERVDYLAVRDRHLPVLTAYLDALAKVDPAPYSEREQLAFWFNLYNASMIAAVVERLRAGWSPAADDYAVFKAKLVRTSAGAPSREGSTVAARPAGNAALGEAGSRLLTLDEVEHEVLRKRFTEPRLHVALVCAARSCPPLLPRAYRASDLEEVLEANMARFLRDPSRNAVDHAAKKLRLSRIFDWFKPDFGGDQGVKALVGRHLGRDVGGYAIDYLDYDWRLNLAVPAGGTLVQVTQEAALSSSPVTDDVLAEVRAGDLLHACADADGMTEVLVPRGNGQRGFLPTACVRRL